ncbi:MAG: SDR family NAD(P)-dependent oxidoreductase, partial [Variovorax sp.]|uniref:SDR family NAD(P)-dependent oxidoreductase n=1 Tax=Variovorax sp. TaxID=1871043 RepID=UPI004037B4E8
MQANSLSGRHALVTGAARGIGAEIARTLAAEGAVLTRLGVIESAYLVRLAGVDRARTALRRVGVSGGGEIALAGGAGR